MAWIELHQSLFDHRKTMAAADALDLPEVYVVGHLSALWCWCLDNAPDGILPDSKRIIAKGARWTGDPVAFVDALLRAGFIRQNVETHGKLEIVNWGQYGGKLIRRKEHNAQQMRESRSQGVANTAHEPADDAESTTSTRVEHVETRVDPEKSREEKRTEEDKGLPSGEPRATAKPESRESKPKRRSQLPEDWRPSARQRDALGADGYSGAEIDAECAKFLNHHLHKGDVGLDWPRSFANWMARSREFGQPRAPTNGHAARHDQGGQRLLTSADLRRIAEGEDPDEPIRNGGPVVEAQFRVAEPAHQR